MYIFFLFLAWLYKCTEELLHYHGIGRVYVSKLLKFYGKDFM